MNHKTPRTRLLHPSTLALLGVFLLSGCATVTTEPLSTETLSLQNQSDHQAYRKDFEPISGPLTLNEAIARALKYNLERRAKMMEEALALRQLDVSQHDMLPKMVAQAGYSDRSIDRATYSSAYSPIPGPRSNTSSVSQDRAHSTADLGLTWSMLDYGLGYYNTQQQGDRVLAAMEKRRKAMHLLMQDVRTAYWRAASAQKLRSEVEKTIKLAEEALVDSRKVEAERIRNPLDALRYQRQLLENLRLLESIDQELSSAQVELTSLINAPLGSTIQIAPADEKNADSKVLQVPVQMMEEAALLQNADLREQHYNARMARLETQKTMARLFPNLSFSYGLKYDSDNYLVNNTWNETGLQLSFNLFNLMTGPTQMKLAEAGVALADQRRMATQLAVLTQVHLARLQFINARSQFDRADAIYTTDLKIAEHVRNRENAQAQSKLDTVANATSSILSLLRRYQALAQVQAAENRLLANLGLEPKIGSTSELSLEQLVEKLKESSNPWADLQSTAALAAPPALTPQAPPAKESQ